MQESNFHQNIISLKELLDKGFFIPAYQRGYRWEEEQVTELLNDIKEFSQNRESDSNNFYCLQPVVVKKMSDDRVVSQELDVRKTWYEVLDGQQRLTTIFLIMKNIVERERRVEEYALKEPFDHKLYDIHYETRPCSTIFLGKSVDDMRAQSNDYIDYFYIHQASTVISQWFRDRNTMPEKRSIFDVDFLVNTKVIWYEEQGDDVIEAFTRLNMNKIKLCNAELVKSLFLNSSNFDNCNKEYIRLRQLEIATEWDRIEYTLRNDDLWGFLTPNMKEDYSCRIEYILDLISEKPKECKSENYTFKYFNDKLKNQNIIDKQQAICNEWLLIKRYFQTIEDWFNNKEYYHKVGFLLSVNCSIRDIVKEWHNNRFKFSEFLKQEIIAKVGGEDVLKDISCLEYKTKYLKNILLLHNVLTISCDENSSSRFSFAKYKSEKWDVEHIHATADEIDGDKKCQAWLDDTRKYIKDVDLQAKMITYDPNTFQDIYSRVVNQLGYNNNAIGNLCLLDAGTNRGYGCAVFPYKRSKILEKHKHGKFIPICTLNVFNKFYSNSVENMTIWDESSQKDYVGNIKEVINEFLKNDSDGK